jgi:hypothetical protein
MGGHEATQGLLRLFMIPGFDHCGWQPGLGITELGFDPLTALEDWVEKGEAPASMLATKQDNDGKTVWTRPLCSYPQKARYKSGDVNVARTSPARTELSAPSSARWSANIPSFAARCPSCALHGTQLPQGGEEAASK